MYDQLELRFDALMEELRQANSRGREVAFEHLPCAYWPSDVESYHAATEFTYDGTAPVLVVGTTGDAATSYADAQALASVLGAKGRLLTLNGIYHAPVYSVKNTCLQNAATAYLTDLTLPQEGLTCTLPTLINLLDDPNFTVLNPR